MTYAHNRFLAFTLALGAAAGASAVMAQTGQPATGEKPSPMGGPASSGSVGTAMGDSAITAKIKTAFAADKMVSAMAIKVETKSGEVLLSGFAKSDAEKKRAGEIAQTTEGVRNVRNSIAVRP